VGLVTRAAAFALDAAIVNGAVLIASGLVAALISAISPGDESASTPVVVLGTAVWIAAGATYLVAFWALAGQTPGMRFLGIRVDADGNRGIGARRALRRLVGLVLAVIPFGAGLLGIVLSDRRRGFHDRFARTEVLYADVRDL
jgi:uncharacterized RDD family membrane protein YckC